MSAPVGSPERIAPVLLAAALLTAGITAGVVLAVHGITSNPFAPSSAQSVPTPPPPCPSTNSTQFHGIGYWVCDVTIDWSTASMWGPTQTSSALVHGVGFEVFGYDTIDCPVVNVTGQEPGGVATSFLIYPTPVNCSFLTPTVIAPDGSFGATWSGGPTVSLLVRAA